MDPEGSSVTFADLPIAQAVNTVTPQALPGGSGQTGFNFTTGYYPETEVVAWFTKAGDTSTPVNPGDCAIIGGVRTCRYDHVIAGSYHGSSGAGKVTYIGGHSYDQSVPYSTNFEGPYLRMFFNSIFFNGTAPCQF